MKTITDDGRNHNSVARIAQGIGTIVFPGEVLEIRVLGGGPPYSGYFDDPKAAAVAIAQLKHEPTGSYVTLNPLKDELLGRRNNFLDVAKSGQSASDSDVVRRRWLYLDIDSVRSDASSSATEEEKRHAEDLMGKVIGFLQEHHGWPTPLQIDSGNGYHAFYRIHLATDDERSVKRILQGLAEQFNNDRAIVDVTVSNASRIVRIPGTWNRKGKNEPDRPHRQSSIFFKPITYEIISQEQLEKLASTLKPVRTGPKSSGSVTQTESRRSNNVVERFRSYARKMEPAISGQNGSDVAYRAAAEANRFGLTREEALSVLASEWNDTCIPPWSEKELKHKIDSAYEKHPAEHGTKSTETG